MFGDEPVGSTRGGRDAPIMLDDDRFEASHWCNPVGARVYCDKLDCPRCGPDADEEEEEDL